MDEEKKEEEQKREEEKQSYEQSEVREEEVRKETEPIPGVEQAKEAMGMAQGVIGKIGNLIGGIFGCSKQEKKE